MMPADACAGVIPVLFTVAAAASWGVPPFCRLVHTARPVAAAVAGSVTVIPGISDTRDRKLWSGLGGCGGAGGATTGAGILETGGAEMIWVSAGRCGGGATRCGAGTGGMGRGGGGCCATGWVGDGGGPCSGDAASVLCAEAVVSLEIE